MPDMWELVETNWPLIAQHPWLFIKWAAFWLIVGLLVGRAVGRRMISQQAVVAAAPVPEPALRIFEYPERGRHGPNTLSNRTTTARVQEELSFTAQVPPKQTLRIVLEGPPHPTQSSMFQNPGWGFSVMGAQNWKVREWEPIEAGWRQAVDANEGLADLSFRFYWAGTFTVTAYEGDSHDEAWAHAIRVEPPAG